MVGMSALAASDKADLSSCSAWSAWPPSSAASWIQLSLGWRDEPLDEELEGAAVCRLHAEARAASLSSSGVEIGRTMSWGANFSLMLMKWTATRAVGRRGQHWIAGRQAGRQP